MTCPRIDYKMQQYMTLEIIRLYNTKTDTRFIVVHSMSINIYSTVSLYSYRSAVALTAFFDQLRMLAPYAKNKTGIGIIATARNASRDVAQGIPSLSYICDANSGKPAPNKARTALLLAMALFATGRYTSTR